MDSSTDCAEFWSEVKQPKFQAHAAINAFISEMSKGCTDTVYNYPLKSIVPQFDHFDYRDIMYRDSVELVSPGILTDKKEFKHLKLLFSIEDGYEWLNAMSCLLANIYDITSSVYFEIIKAGMFITYQITSPSEYADKISDTLQTVLKNCQIEVTSKDVLPECIKSIQRDNILIQSFYPNPPYFRNLYSPETKTTTNIYQLLSSISKLERNDFFYYRVTIEPARERWDRNCYNGYQYERKVFNFYSDFNCDTVWFVPPQAESKKAISDKLDTESLPLFCIQPMIVLSCKKSKSNSIKSFWNSFRFSDVPYNHISENKILNTISFESFISSLIKRENYIHGHLLNRKEASFLMPMPCKNSLENISIPLCRISDINNEYINNGLIIGKNNGGECITLPQNAIENGIALIGSPGYGKTNLLLNLLSQVAEYESPKYSIIVFYFHDFEFVVDFVSRIPKERLNDVILAMPSLQGKILARNIVETVSPRTASRNAAYLAYALENSSASFGIDIKRRIKNLFHCLLVCDNTSLAHVFNILNRHDELGVALRNEVRKKCTNIQVLQYLNEIEAKNEYISSVSNKLQDFFDDADITDMFSFQGKSKINYSDVVENGNILIWYLGDTGPGGNAIASMEVSTLHQHFLDYGKAKKKKRYSTIVAIDEVQRIKSQGIADSIQEDRKHGLSYFLSTQTLQGVDSALVKGIDLISNMAYFQCTPADAKIFSSKSAGIVSQKDIELLPKYQAYARLQSAANIAKCKTVEFEPGDERKIDFVIKNSLEKYYIEPEKIEIRNDKKTINKVKEQFLSKMNSILKRR